MMTVTSNKLNHVSDANFCVDSFPVQILHRENAEQIL